MEGGGSGGKEREGEGKWHPPLVGRKLRPCGLMKSLTFPGELAVGGVASIGRLTASGVVERPRTTQPRQALGDLRVVDEPRQ